MDIVLYYAPNTCALVPFVALNEAGATFRVEALNFRKKQQMADDYLRLNPPPQGSVAPRRRQGPGGKPGHPRLDRAHVSAVRPHARRSLDVRAGDLGRVMVFIGHSSEPEPRSTRRPRSAMRRDRRTASGGLRGLRSTRISPSPTRCSPDASSCSTTFPQPTRICSGACAARAQLEYDIARWAIARLLRADVGAPERAESLCVREGDTRALFGVGEAY